MLGIGRKELGAQIEDFVAKYNEKSVDKIDKSHFDILTKSNPPRGGHLLEILGRYGNPSNFDFPTPLKLDQTCDFSFTGL